MSQVSTNFKTGATSSEVKNQINEQLPKIDPLKVQDDVRIEGVSNTATESLRIQIRRPSTQNLYEAKSQRDLSIPDEKPNIEKRVPLDPHLKGEIFQ